MDFPQIIIFLFPFIFASSAFSFCPITTCTNNTITRIRFPFHLENQKTENCSYPGFNLHCTKTGRTAITLPHSGEFLVRSINYESQNILINDPNQCLPRRLLQGFDPSGSPFQSDFYVNYTFLSCPRDFTDARYAVIECLSNSTRSVIASSHTDFSVRVSNKACKMIKTLEVPASMSEDGGFTTSLGDGVWLSWHVPDCKDCEVKGGVCGFQKNGNKQIGCFYNLPNSGDEKQAEKNKGLKVFRIIAFSIAFPAILCAFGIGLFLCIMDRRDRNRSARINSTLQQITATDQPLDTTMGLDQATIDSYTKVVLGESRRVPGLNDGSCPICLSDFSAKETLRCIPDCKHCFHADCIDEWLKMNGTCPLCRTSPAHPAQVQIVC
ncbi:putative RING-H2 finger protein ATL21A [Amaranthus tricolor]|uniref:putative RING-H2 finger protein ATL21A n=1 Tax=Amaranthus tricolor TaxID=29722 RepID=UPI00258806C5|nr:putative RING-H2 finger protein ATL21A [Amaranthus tricolor]